MVAVEMGVDQVFYREIRDASDCGLDLVVQRREFAVHHDDAVFRHRHGNIAALTLQHVDVVAEIGGLDLHFGEIDRRGSGRRLLLLGEGMSRQPHRGCGNSDCGPDHEMPPRRRFWQIPSTGMHGLPSCELSMSLLECGLRRRAAKRSNEQMSEETT